jgi:Na+/phosphate symporter
MTADPRLPAAGQLPNSGNVNLRVYTPAGTNAAPAPASSRRPFGRLGRALIAGFSLWLFLAAIAVMKDGAAPLGDLLQGSTLTDSVASTLGFGWLGAMIVMSGSPVAVAALTMFGGGAVSADQALTMLTGSRLGAAFVVLTVSFLYAVRGNAPRDQRRASVSIGIYALTLTAIVYLPALAVALPMLNNGVFDGLDLAAPGSVLNIVKVVIGPIVSSVESVVPTTPGLLFLAGLAMLLVSVRLVDLALPEAADAAHLEEHSDWRSRKWVMFGVGSLVALVTMSVSVALTVLVPAVAKGYFRRRQVMPYIMGANITTLGDTLLTAFLVGNPVAVHVVLAELACITVVTMILLTFFYPQLQDRVTRFSDCVLDERPRLVGFVAVLFVVPLTLIFIF